jgi:hypothetical protein
LKSAAPFLCARSSSFDICSTSILPARSLEKL